MPYVPVPKDLTRIKTKVAFGLTRRQLVCFSIAGAIGLPVYFFTREPIGNSAAMLLMIGLMSPFFFMAMFERDGQPAEKILKNMFRHRMWPLERPYRTENLYKSLSEKEVSAIDKDQAAGSAGKTPARKHPGGQTDPRRGKEGRK